MGRSWGGLGEAPSDEARVPSEHGVLDSRLGVSDETLSCGHVYHTECLTQQVERFGNCGACAQPVSMAQVDQAIAKANEAALALATLQRTTVEVDPPAPASGASARQRAAI